MNYKKNELKGNTVNNCMPTNYLTKIDNFLGRQKLPKLTQEKLKNQDRLMTSKEIILVTKKTNKNPTEEIPGAGGFTGTDYQTREY